MVQQRVKLFEIPLSRQEIELLSHSKYMWGEGRYKSSKDSQETQIQLKFFIPKFQT